MRDKAAAVRIARDIRPVVSTFTAAAGLMRSISIKRFVPKSRQREFALLARNPGSLPARCQIFHEKSAGAVPIIVLGGFVPDVTEALEFQRKLLRQHGSIYYVNYSRMGFSLEMFTAQLTDLIEHIARKGQRPLIMGVSFGCGLLANFLQNAGEQVHQNIRGIVMISPVLTTDDLIRPNGRKRDGVRILESNLKKIVSTDPDDESHINKHIERSRKCFQALFNAGAENRVLNVRHLAIRKKINDVMENTTTRGGFERVMAMCDFIFPEPPRTLFSGPALVLLAENETDILVSSSPTLQLFGNESRYVQLLPSCRVKTVRSRIPGDGVAHASMIFHYEAYNEMLDNWYAKLLYPQFRLAA